MHVESAQADDRRGDPPDDNAPALRFGALYLREHSLQSGGKLGVELLDVGLRLDIAHGLHDLSFFVDHEG